MLDLDRRLFISLAFADAIHFLSNPNGQFVLVQKRNNSYLIFFADLSSGRIKQEDHSKLDAYLIISGYRYSACIKKGPDKIFRKLAAICQYGSGFIYKRYGELQELLNRQHFADQIINQIAGGEGAMIPVNWTKSLENQSDEQI